jgi:cellulose synthase/poly-beta-1,6-N-acetylglucosamine synthase-like glycosyltransferase
VLLPARNEEEVIQSTIQCVLDANYPRGLTEIAVICRIDDTGTIAKVQEKIAQLVPQGVTNVRLIVFQDLPINKPHGLNIGLRNTNNEVVTIFDSEDDVHPEVFNVINTVMVNEGVNVVQSGVQLMNYDSHWFSALNVLEYFFWFKSRLHYHSEVGIIPLGGNTIFFTRRLLNQIGGWDETCLTEDADIGIRLSQMGERVRVVYEDAYVTKEETPPSVGQFIKQRTRWNQGFLQILKRGDYWRLPRFEQRLLALYTLSSPIFQALTALYLPLSLYTMFFVKMPPLIAMILWLPAYMLIGQYVMNLVGLYEFASAHSIKLPKMIWLKLLGSFYPFQVLLGISALRAVWREMQGMNTWEKTKHVNAHRGTTAG